MRIIEERIQKELRKKGVKINETKKNEDSTKQGAGFYEWKMENDNKGCTNSIFHLRGCHKMTYYSPPRYPFSMYIFLGENICAPPMFYVICVLYDVLICQKLCG